MDPKQQQLEHDYHRHIQQMIHADIQSREHILQAKDDAYETLRDEFFDNPLAIVRDTDDIINLYEQNRGVSDAQQEVLDARRRLGILYKQQNSPYFGSFCFHDGQQRRTFYIGSFAYCDTKTLDYYVYDWRAPISSLYYEYDVGPASYDTPRGVRNGKLECKRLFRIQDGSIQYMYDAQSMMQDEILAQTLGQNTRQHLKSIVSSIQREQNRAIRYPADHHMLITGPAGSGKTSVGLHWMAYLLYHQRDRLRSKQVVILSNNQVFSHYIATLIPELGEDGVVQTVYYDQLRSHFDEDQAVEDFYQQSERKTHASAVEALAVRIKCSAGFARYLMDEMDNMALQFTDVRYGNDVIVSKAVLAQQFHPQNYPVLAERLGALDYYLEEMLHDYFTRHREKIQRTLERQSDDFLQSSQLDVRFHSIWDQCLLDAQTTIRRLNHLTPQRYPVMVQSYCAQQGVSFGDIHCSDPIASSLHYEDANAILLLRMLMGDVIGNPATRHVLIDEAQDYSPVQMEIVQRLYPRSRFTLLADGNQSITPDVSVTTQQMQQSLGTIDHLRLCQTYRSTGAIHRFAQHWLPSSEDIQYFDRAGERPQWIATDQPVEAIQVIIDTMITTDRWIGIVTVDTATADRLYENLRHSMDVQRLTRPQDTLQQRVVILPVMLAKGLEFDAVILPDFPSIPSHMRYLMCTRVLHQLFLLGSAADDVENVGKLVEVMSLDSMSSDE